MKEALGEESVRNLRKWTERTLNYFSFKEGVESYLEYLKERGWEHLLIEVKNFVNKKVDSLLEDKG